jgi:hypothetical protein
MHPLDHIMKKRLSHAHTPVESYNWDKISEKLDGIDNQKPKHIFLRSTLGTASIICLLLISGFLGFNIYDSSQVLPLAIKNTHTSDHTNKVSPIAFSTTTGSSHSSSTFQQSSTSRESIKQRSTSFTNPVQNDIANNLNELSIESNNLTSPNTIQQTSNAINKPNIFNTKAQSSTISTLDNRLIESKSISNATRQSAVIDHLSIMTSLPSSTNRKLEILPLLTNNIVSIDSDLGARKTYRKLNNKVSKPLVAVHSRSKPITKV